MVRHSAGRALSAGLVGVAHLVGPYTEPVSRTGASFGAVGIAASGTLPERGETAREAACLRLARQAARFPDLDLRPLETEGLDERDAALAHAIFDHAQRRWITLEYLLDTRSEKPMRSLEPALRAVLLAGAAQVLLLDRIPDHAAINESVELAKRLVRPGAAGLANAVLRGLVRLRGGIRERWTDKRDEIPLADGRALGLSEAVLPEPLNQLWAAATGHPAWLVERWCTRLGEPRARDLALHGVVVPPVVLNMNHASGEPILQSVPHSREGFRIYTGGRGGLGALLGTRRDLWVQDPASARVVVEAAPRLGSPGLVIDLCAGRGTKTRQLFFAFPGAAIVATDVDDTRRSVLADVFKGEKRVQVLPHASVLTKFAGKAGLVLLDVPCSNTGVLARRFEAKYRVSERSLAQLVELQRRIITDGAGLLGPGGAMLYATCSVEEDENEAQASWAAGSRGLTPAWSSSEWPAGLPGEDPADYHDGSFSALLRK